MVAKRSAPETTTRNVGPLTGRAAFSPGSVNDKARTVDVLWSTGAKVLRSSWFDGQSYEELSMDPAHVRMGRLNNGAPFLADHRGALDSVMGVVVKGSAKLQNGQGVATVRFPAEGVDPKADQLFAKVRDGVVQNISVGYRTYKSEKVEGGDEKIPTFRAVDWEPYEISAVAMGADDQAGFRSANFNQPNECVFVTRKGSTMEIDNESSNDVVADERARVSAIRALCKTARLDARIENDLIKRGGDLNDVRNAIIDLMALRDQEHPTDNHYTPIDGGESVAYGRFAMGRTDTEKFNECAAAALVLRSGSSVVDHAIQTKARGFENSKLDAGDLAGLGLYEIAKRTVERAGLKTGGKSREQIASLALTHRSSALAAASDFGVLYEQAIGKILLGAYATAPDSWRAFCPRDADRLEGDAICGT